VRDPRKTYRVEICKECGKDWIVSRFAVIPINGYLCPVCWRRQRNEEYKRQEELKV